MNDVLFYTGTSNFSKTVNTLVLKRLEEALRGGLIHLQAGAYVPAEYVAGSNGTLRFIGYSDLPSTTSSIESPTPGTAPWLTEGTTPYSEAMGIVYDEITAYQAGRIIKLTDIALSESPSDLISVASDKISFDVKLTIDKYVAAILKAGTNRIYAGSSNTQLSDVASGDVLTVVHLRKAVNNLKRRAVPPFPDGYYRAIVHPDSIYDLQADTTGGGWADFKYTTAEPLMSGEVARLAGVRIFESPYAGILEEAGTSAVDVYSTSVFGPGAFTFGDLQTTQVFFTPPGGSSDPLHQRAQVGWKAMFGAALLDAQGARYCNIISAPAMGS